MKVDKQMQVYHDRTAFWLDREWKTPREKQLEKELEKERNELIKRLDIIEKRLDNASQVVRTLLAANELRYFCPHCEKPAYAEYDKQREIVACQNCKSEVF